MLVWANHSIVAVDACRHTRPDTLAIIAVLDEALAAGKCVLHGLAFTIIKHSWVSTLTASHGLVVFILSQTISKTVTNENGLQVDIALLMRQDLGSEDGDVVASIRLSSDVEILLGILGELLEEKGEKSIDILSSSDGITDSATTVRVPDINGLIEEYD